MKKARPGVNPNKMQPPTPPIKQHRVLLGLLIIRLLLIKYQRLNKISRSDNIEPREKQ